MHGLATSSFRRELGAAQQRVWGCAPRLLLLCLEASKHLHELQGAKVASASCLEASKHLHELQGAKVASAMS